MNSLLKQDPSQSPGLSSESFVLRFKETLGNMNSFGDLEMLMKKLQYLGLHFDPFDQVVSSECQEILKQLDLTEQFQNPYQATNMLLRLLDLTEERINQIKQ